MRIETENLIIRKFKASDWKDLSEILTDDNVIYYEPYAVFTVAECRFEAIKFARSDCFFAVTLKDSEKVVGKIYFKKLDDFCTYDLGFTFNALYQGKGYATESIKAFLNYSFSNTDARRVICNAQVENELAWKLLERIGMKREGQHRKTQYKFLDSQGKKIWMDTYSYAMLKEDLNNCDNS